MPSSKCPKYESCSAPLCPLDTQSPISNTYFPGEDICKAKRFQSLGWVKKQKAIAKLKPSGYFTIAMLKAIRRISKSIEGIDSDSSLDKATKAEETWIKGLGKSSKISPEATERPKKASVPWKE